MENISRRNFLKRAGLATLGLAGIVGAGVYTSNSFNNSESNLLEPIKESRPYSPPSRLGMSREKILSSFSDGYLESHSFGRDPHQVLHLYLPGDSSVPSSNEELATSDLLIYIHGGGWKALNPEDFSLDHADYFIPKGIPAASIGYPLMYKRRTSSRNIGIEDQIKSCLEGTRVATRIFSEKYGIDVPNVVFMGDSAGAHLAYETAFRALNEDEDFKVRAVMGVSGPYRLDGSIGSDGKVGKTLDEEYGSDNLGMSMRKDLSPFYKLASLDRSRLPYFGLVSFEGDWGVSQDQADMFFNEMVSNGLPALHLRFIGTAGHVFAILPSKKTGVEILSYDGNSSSKISKATFFHHQDLTSCPNETILDYLRDVTHRLEERFILHGPEFNLREDPFKIR